MRGGSYTWMSQPPGVSHHHPRPLSQPSPPALRLKKALAEGEAHWLLTHPPNPQTNHLPNQPHTASYQSGRGGRRNGRSPVSKRFRDKSAIQEDSDDKTTSTRAPKPITNHLNMSLKAATTGQNMKNRKKRREGDRSLPGSDRNTRTPPTNMSRASPPETIQANANGKDNHIGSKPSASGCP